MQIRRLLSFPVFFSLSFSSVCTVDVFCVVVVQFLPHASTRKVLFLALSVTFFIFLVGQSNISGTAAPISQRRRIRYLARVSLNVNVKGQRSRPPGTKKGKLLRHPHRQCVVKRVCRTLQVTCSRRRDYSVAAGGDGLKVVHGNGNFRRLTCGVCLVEHL